MSNEQYWPTNRASMHDRERLMKRHGRALPRPSFRPDHTALLLVDFQYYDAHPDYGVLKRFSEQGLHDVVDYYIDRLQKMVIPNARKLLDVARTSSFSIFYTVIESSTPDGRDRTRLQKALDMFVAPGSIEAKILPELSPLPQEVILRKTCSDAFKGTNLDYFLRNLGIETLIVAGLVTTGCVESAVRSASDDYSVILVEDCCASWSQEMHDSACFEMNEIFAKVMRLDELIQTIHQERS